MDEIKKQIKNLYEDAAFLHLVHSGHKMRRDQFKFNWED